MGNGLGQGRGRASNAGPQDRRGVRNSISRSRKRSHRRHNSWPNPDRLLPDCTPPLAWVDSCLIGTPITFAADGQTRKILIDPSVPGLDQVQVGDQVVLLVTRSVAVNVKTI